MRKTKNKLIKDDAVKQPRVENPEEQNLFSNIQYICNSTTLITDSLQQGFDVAQLPNGDIIVTEIRTVNVQYKWDVDKQRMVKISQR
jgi:glucose/arabinose dehydrogenase